MGLKKKSRLDPRNLLLIFLSTSFTIVLLELLLRVIFSTNQTYLIEESHDRPFLVDNKYWKVWHYTNSEANHKKDCFEATYFTNQWGMHDQEVSITKDSSKIRIALMGDSFVEGYGVSRNKNFSSILDSISHQNIEILNFGLSGGIGTVHELALYENLVRHFKPDIVLLFYLNYNDLYDNYKAIHEGLVSSDLEFTYKKGSLEEVLSEIKANPSPTATNKVIKNSYCLSLASKGIRTCKSFLQSTINMKADFKKSLSDNYDSIESETIQIGYQIAINSLKKMDSLTNYNNSELIVIQFPDPYQIDRNWLLFSSEKYNQQLNPTYPNQRLKHICGNLKIKYYDMYPEAMNYIKKNDLSFPYFSQTCDRHPSEKGHQYFATQVDKILKSEILN